MSEIIVPAWFPRPQHRTDRIGVIPLDNTALNELIDGSTKLRETMLWLLVRPRRETSCVTCRGRSVFSWSSS